MQCTVLPRVKPTVAITVNTDNKKVHSNCVHSLDFFIQKVASFLEMIYFFIL